MVTQKYAIGPTVDEVVEAIYAGYRAVDDGIGFWHGFDAYLVERGYQKVDEAPCTCPDAGWHGHMPECRWLRNWPA